MRSQKQLLAQFDEYLKEQIRELRPSKTRDAMEYALFGSGKRIRPLLLFRMLESCGLPPETGFAQAAAIEMIHTYSLIHDDLPAMDNDDFRRGRPSCHKQFSEDIAILAGDALLTQAFLQALKTDGSPKQKNRLVELLSQKAGAEGMVYGQELDILSESSKKSPELLEEVEKYKTGCLIELPLLSGAVLANFEHENEAIESIGEKIGIFFQIQDDILDATKTAEELGKSNSDARNDKLTAVSLAGLEESRKRLDELACEIEAQIREVLPDPKPVLDLFEELRNRQK